MLHECPVCNHLVDDGALFSGICFDCIDNYDTYKDTPLDYLNNDGLMFMAKYNRVLADMYSRYYSLNCT